MALMPDAALPRILVVSDGRSALPEPFLSATLLRDLDLATLVAVSGSAHPPLAVDLDGVEGLAADQAGVRFVVETLGIRVALTRRPAAAARWRRACAACGSHAMSSLSGSRGCSAADGSDLHFLDG
jgi:hypothetical protein